MKTMLTAILVLLPVLAGAQGDQDKLRPAGLKFADYFGAAVALEGDYAAVSAIADDTRAFEGGAVYVFHRTNGVWSEQAKLLPPVADPWDNVGWSLALSGDTILAGSPGRNNSLGVVYVFRRTGSNWTLETQLSAPDPSPGMVFGDSLDLEGETALIGAPSANRMGAAYVFTRSGTTWTFKAKLVAADPGSVDRFGDSVSLSGSTALIGAPQDDDRGKDSGSAYLFRRSGTAWSQLRKFLALDGDADDRFGRRVSVRGGHAVISALYDDDARGSAYFYALDRSAWVFRNKVAPADRGAADQFGAAVAMGDGYALIGGPFNDERGDNAGAAYYYKLNGDRWYEIMKYVGSDCRGLGDYFGHAVAVHGGECLIGAPGLEANVGAAYVCRLLPLCVSDHRIDARSRETLRFFLNAGETNARRVYRLAGSLGGTVPGVALGAHNLPLNPDPYFYYTVQVPNAFPMTRSLGYLDLNGWADAGFTMPLGVAPAVVGLKMYYAYAVLNGNVPVLTSNAVAIEFVQ